MNAHSIAKTQAETKLPSTYERMRENTRLASVYILTRSLPKSARCAPEKSNPSLSVDLLLCVCIPSLAHPCEQSGPFARVGDIPDHHSSPADLKPLSVFVSQISVKPSPRERQHLPSVCPIARLLGVNRRQHPRGTAASA